MQQHLQNLILKRKTETVFPPPIRGSFAKLARESQPKTSILLRKNEAPFDNCVLGITACAQLALPIRSASRQSLTSRVAYLRSISRSLPIPRTALGSDILPCVSNIVQIVVRPFWSHRRRQTRGGRGEGGGGWEKGSPGRSPFVLPEINIIPASCAHRLLAPAQRAYLCRISLGFPHRSILKMTRSAAGLAKLVLPPTEAARSRTFRTFKTCPRIAHKSGTCVREFVYR